MTEPQFAYHIAFTNIPDDKPDVNANLISLSRFRSGIKNYYTNFKNEVKAFHVEDNKTQKLEEYYSEYNLYNPDEFYIFGGYDLAYVSIIDSLKFVQKVFIGDEAAPFHTITGPISNQNNCNGGVFISICNLKLNNKFLVGNGVFFINNVIESIAFRIDNRIKFTIMQSYSWNEITIILRGDNPNIFKDIIQVIRALTLNDLKEKDKVFENSIINNTSNSINEYINSHVISESFTYFGAEYEHFTDRKNYDFYKSIKLDAFVEWQIKPGHFEKFVTLLKAELKEDFNNALIFGRSDLIIMPKNKNLGFIQLLHTTISDNKFFLKHFRGYKTKILLDEVNTDLNSDNKSDNECTDSKELQDELCFNKGFRNFFQNEIDYSIPVINNHLKSVKISRQERLKVIKIFMNFQQGIANPILSIFFIDFLVFIKNLNKLIAESNSKINELFPDKTIGNKNLAEIKELQNNEKILITYITSFEKAYNIRMLNTFLYNDLMSDFQVSLNTSIPSLLSTFTFITANVVNSLSANKKNDYSFVPIISIDLKSSVSNLVSINFSLHHLFCPEFVFFTITKEILNQGLSMHKISRDLFANTVNKNLNKISNFTKNQLNTSSHNVPDNLLIESLRFINTFHRNFELYSYWYWAYILQNPDLHTALGVLAEKSFISELFRFLFTAKINNQTSNFKCPIIELENYWVKHYYRINNAVEELVDIFDNNNPFQDSIDTLESMNNRISKLMRDEFALTGNEDNFRKVFADAFYNRYKSKIENGEVILNMLNVHGIDVDKIFMNTYMYAYMQCLFDQNNGVLHTVNRNWKTGEPSNFLNKKIYSMVAFDSNGGIFVNNYNNKNSYFKIRNGCLQTLNSYSMIIKKDFILRANIKIIPTLI